MTQEQHKYYSNGYDDGKQSTGDQYLQILLKKDQEIETLKAENTQLKKQLQDIKEEHDFRNKPLM